jgi:hypothetical protein
MTNSDEIREILQVSKKIFGEKNCEVIQKDLLSDKLKIEYPNIDDSNFVVNLYIDKLVWGEAIIVLEILNKKHFVAEEPFLYHLEKKMNLETKWFFPTGKTIKDIPTFSEFILVWLQEYLILENSKLDIYKKYIDIRIDPHKKFRDWKLRKFL